jgi:hypothetical protein
VNTTTSPARRVSAVAAATLLLIGIPALSASARQDRGDAPANTVETATQRCGLERVGTQFVKCDNLTGNGVPAPAWVPER